ncbi:MAG: 2-hydroxyacyl-CoA dehydratase family protein [Candidatus Adiutrix sp.]|jgi:benzoyl-CoA reductase/2-hydroxyglutaryl-CoA dehydratase subunit BcrC/BadD/HgdB|nr:2-hydroxyacyl-CoA dehydratase family protein [Candidatus Adiutrix sp.]
MSGPASNERRERVIKKAADKAALEMTWTLERLRGRPDRKPAYDYFLKLAADGLSPAKAAERTGRPVVNLMCLQAPLELIHAAGFQPFKVFSGSPAEGGLAAQGFPALMCPMLRSVLGAVQVNRFPGSAAWVLPTTCDWLVKFPEMLKLAGTEIEAPLHWLELPHLKDGPEGRERWLDEVYRLKFFLEKLAGGRKIDRRQLRASIAVYDEAWRALGALAEKRRRGQLAAPWFFLLTGAFFLDRPEHWSEAVRRVLPQLEPGPEAPRVFLAGSPIFLPNFKLLWLMEEAGLAVAADDLCSGERLLPGGVNYSDASEFGLVSALAQRYHQGCLCPTFIDNDRRVNNILGPARQGDFKAVVFQVLKGCHPFDLESLTIEGPIRDQGLKYLRLETDYSPEDSQNLLTRLEAYRRTLGEDHESQHRP